MLHILDAECISMLPQRVKREHRLTVLNALTDAVSEQLAGFPPEVATEARRLADESDEAWLHAVAAAVRLPDVPYEYVMRAHAGCPRLLGFEAGFTSYEPSGPYVCAAALMFQATGEVAVVTEELTPLPDRISLGQACEDLQIKVCSLSDFISDLPGCTVEMLN